MKGSGHEEPQSRLVIYDNRKFEKLPLSSISKAFPRIGYYF